MALNLRGTVGGCLLVFAGLGPAVGGLVFVCFNGGGAEQGNFIELLQLPLSYLFGLRPACLTGLLMGLMLNGLAAARPGLLSGRSRRYHVLLSVVTGLAALGVASAFGWLGAVAMGRAAWVPMAIATVACSAVVGWTLTPRLWLHTRPPTKPSGSG